MIERIFDKLHNKRILLLGYGREGRSSLKFLLEHRLTQEIGIADQNEIDSNAIPSFVQLHTGTNYLDATTSYEILIKSPGIPTELIPVLPSQILTSQTDLFLDAYHRQTIGVTGTKGKSTTSSLIHFLLQSLEANSLITGNIGYPCFESIPKITDQTIIVFELSAHQLEQIHHSPRIAVLLNLFEEHLDHFKSKEAYFEAKKQIYAFGQSDQILIAHRELQHVLKVVPQHTIYYPLSHLTPYQSSSLPGQHNADNVQAALLAVEAAGFSIPRVAGFLMQFKPLPHRLEYLGCISGVHFYNDSIATVPEASIKAIESLGNVDWLILGGFDRAIHYEAFADFLCSQTIRHLLLTGQAGSRIKEALDERKYKGSMRFFGTIQEVFSMMETNAKANDICLLSPAAASYDQYKNFEQRGEIFKALAKKFSLK